MSKGSAARFIDNQRAERQMLVVERKQYYALLQALGLKDLPVRITSREQALLLGKVAMERVNELLAMEKEDNKGNE